MENAAVVYSTARQHAAITRYCFTNSVHPSNAGIVFKQLYASTNNFLHLVGLSPYSFSDLYIDKNLMGRGPVTLVDSEKFSNFWPEMLNNGNGSAREQMALNHHCSPINLYRGKIWTGDSKYAVIFIGLPVTCASRSSGHVHCEFYS